MDTIQTLTSNSQNILFSLDSMNIRSALTALDFNHSTDRVQATTTAGVRQFRVKVCNFRIIWLVSFLVVFIKLYFYATIDDKTSIFYR